MVILILVAIFIFASYLAAFMRLQFDFQFQQTPQKAVLGALFVPVLLPILMIDLLVDLFVEFNGYPIAKRLWLAVMLLIVGIKTMPLFHHASCYIARNFIDSIFEDAKNAKTFHYVVIRRNILSDKLFDRN